MLNIETKNNNGQSEDEKSYANRVKKKFVFENYAAARESYNTSLANRKKFQYINAVN